MKKIFLILIMSACFRHASAQSGFVANSYYQYQYQISDIAVGYPYQKFDYYNKYIGIYQIWQRALWHKSNGGTYINIWNGGQWVTQWINGTYWWFEWVNYERYIRY